MSIERVFMPANDDLQAPNYSATRAPQPTRQELLKRNSFPSVNDNPVLTKMLEQQKNDK